MARCLHLKTQLEVHHIRRDGGNGRENARVLCQKCHQATQTYGLPGKSPPPFDDMTKSYALVAPWQCECTSTGGCH